MEHKIVTTVWLKKKEITLHALGNINSFRKETVK